MVLVAPVLTDAVRACVVNATLPDQRTHHVCALIVCSSACGQFTCVAPMARGRLCRVRACVVAPGRRLAMQLHLAFVFVAIVFAWMLVSGPCAIRTCRVLQLVRVQPCACLV